MKPTRFQPFFRWLGRAFRFAVALSLLLAACAAAYLVFDREGLRPVLTLALFGLWSLACVLLGWRLGRIGGIGGATAPLGFMDPDAIFKAMGFQTPADLAPHDAEPEEPEPPRTSPYEL